MEDDRMTGNDTKTSYERLVDAFSDYSALRKKYSENTLSFMMGDDYEEVKEELLDSAMEFLTDMINIALDGRQECVGKVNEMLDTLHVNDRIRDGLLTKVDIVAAMDAIADARSQTSMICSNTPAHDGDDEPEL